MMVVLLTTAQWRSKQQVANPRLDEGEGGAVRVPGGHHHLEEQRQLEETGFVCKGLQSFMVKLNIVGMCYQGSVFLQA